MGCLYSSRLPEPANVAEICLFGVENEAFATQAVYEVIEQLKKQTVFNLLIVVGMCTYTLLPIHPNP